MRLFFGSYLPILPVWRSWQCMRDRIAHTRLVSEGSPCFINPQLNQHHLQSRWYEEGP